MTSCARSTAARGVFFAIERQNFGPFANRSETAGVVLEREDATAFAYDLGVTYAY